MKQARFLMVLLLLIPWVARAQHPGTAIKIPESPLADTLDIDVPGLKTVIIDRDAGESHLGLQLDSAGRLFAGCREALYVYEPAPSGLYQPKQLLFRFPKDAWVYDIAIRGDDLYVSTSTAIYLLTGAVKKRMDITAKRLVWGLPMAKGYSMHQGIHGLAIGPEGDFYFSNGDEIVQYGDFKRPDHWSHWTYFHGTQSTKVTGCGGIFRFSPDGEHFSMVASGTRNTCGIAFDRSWNLFTSDNDHESMPDSYVPGRLLHVTSGAYFSWPRGWMPEKTPWRADLLDTMHSDLGRYVPTGMAYYDDTYMPESFRHSLYVAEWRRGKLLRYPLRPNGASFLAEQVEFLTCPKNVRPVGVAVGRGGRIFMSVCHMTGNEASPVYQSEIVMITRQDDDAAASFNGYEETEASLEKLYEELSSDSFQRRYRAHVELLRRGQTACADANRRLENAIPGTPSHTHLLWLAASSGSLANVTTAITSPEAEARFQALRALSEFSENTDPTCFENALNDKNPSVIHAALVSLRDRFKSPPPSRVTTIACSTDRRLRQTAVQLLAARLGMQEIRKLCESISSDERRVGILIAGQRLTIPPSTGELPADWPLSPMRSSVEFVGDTLDVDAGSFTMADVWASKAKSNDEQMLFALLERRLNDSSPDNTKLAAFFLRLLKDTHTDAQCASILGLPSDQSSLATPLEGAKSTGATELPEAYKSIDWLKESGDEKAGEKLFLGRGCSVCHSAATGDTGTGGPSLIGAGSRFGARYLVESVITPNKTVSPVFKWTLFTMQDGQTVAGLVVGETGSEIELLLPSAVRRKIVKTTITNRELQDRSPMPEGLIRSPAEMRDLLTYLLSLKEAK